MSKRIAVVGAHGYVGREMVRLFKEHDPYEYGTDFGTKEEVNKCDVAFICVPTPMMKDGKCDTSIVEEVIGWIETPLIIIRSTVSPGTIEKLIKKTGKHIVFQPEYVGETVAHPLNDTSGRNFLIFGGSKEDCHEALRVYHMVYNASTNTLITTPREAEMIKYMENSFIGTYVVFCNEFFELCKAFDVDYDIVREGFLLDPRMTRFWTFVFEESRGFGGKCIPKDMNGIVHSSNEVGYEPSFLQSVIKENDRMVDLTI